MSAVVVPRLPAAAVNAKLIAMITAAAVSLGVLLSGFVISEPAPYELYMAGLIAIWALFGLRISRAATPLLVLLVTMNIGGMISMTQMADLANTPLYLAVSLFLAFSAVFFASITAVRPNLYRLIFIAYVVSAVATSLLGIAGYFHAFPGAEMFTKYDRAAGAFQDPNVFGPFLVLPGIYLLYLLLTGPVTRMPAEPGGSTSSTGAPGRTGWRALASRPSNSPERLATRIGQATSSGRSLWCRSKASTAVTSPSRTPA